MDSLNTLVMEISINTLTGVRGWPVSTRVMIDTKFDIDDAVYSKAAIPDRMALLLRIMSTSCLQ